MLLVSEDTADAYYNFDSLEPFKDLRWDKTASLVGAPATVASEGDKTAPKAAQIVMLPDRLSPVIYSPSNSVTGYASTTYGSDCLV